MKQFESFELDTADECLWHKGKRIVLPPKPFAVLRYLVENPGRLITHDELLDALWPETYVQPQVLRTYMLDLRKALKDDARQPRFIQSLPKRGYRFVAEVHETQSRRGEAAEAAAGLVGRNAEMKALNAHAVRAASGARQLVFLSGEPGIGKTALADTFLRQLDPSLQAAAVQGHGFPGLAGREEYYPVLEALNQLCTSTMQERVRRVLRSRAPAWAAGMECDAAADAAAQTSGAPGRKPGDLCAALEEITAEKLLILVFEDLQWADDCTLDLISALSRRRTPARLMIVATCGSHGEAAQHPLKALKQDLLVHRLCHEMTLERLTRREIAELLRIEQAQNELPDGLDRFVHLHSEGNPLFAIALLNHLVSEEVLLRGAVGELKWRRGNADAVEFAIPHELVRMIELEIERLDPAKQRLLEAASLFSVATPAWAVAAALDEDAVQTEEACDAMARSLPFLRRAGEDELPDGSRSAFYVFGHGLYRDVLYQRQTATRRARRHIRVAERLRSLFAGREASVAGEMAHHYEAAGDWERAVDTLRSAARHSQQRHATAEAMEMLRHALKIAGTLGNGQKERVQQQIRAEIDSLGTGVREAAGV